jgi:predicted RNA-binding protein with RPS1 domain
VAFGAFTRLPGPVEGLVHVSELVDRRISHPQEVVDEGDVVPLKIVRIEHDRHRLGLSLRDARQEAEQRGWQFDDQGRVMTVPEEAVESFPEEIKAIESRLEARKAEAATRTSAPRRDDSRGDGDEPSAAMRRERDDEPPMTAMAAAMQQAQERAQAEEQQESAVVEAPQAESATATAEPESAPAAEEQVSSAAVEEQAESPAAEEQPAAAAEE